MRELVTGDSVPIEVTVTQDGTAVAVDPTATVTAGLVSIDGRLLAGPWTVLANRTGASWGTGKVIVDVAGAGTINLRPQTCRLEVQVSKAGTIQTRLSKQLISLRKGALPNS